MIVYNKLKSGEIIEHSHNFHDSDGYYLAKDGIVKLLLLEKSYLHLKEKVPTGFELIKQVEDIILYKFLIVGENKIVYRIQYPDQ